MPDLTVIAIIASIVIPPTVILAWKKHSLMILLCPREILLLETTEERKRLVVSGMSAFQRQWSNYIAAIGYLVATALVVYPFQYLTGMITLDGEWKVTRADGWLAAIAWILPMLPVGVSGFVIHVRWRRWMRVFLREHLNAHGVPICMSCGYDLRGQVDRRCPECGRSPARAGTRGDRGEESSRG